MPTFATDHTTKKMKLTHVDDAIREDSHLNNDASEQYG